MPKHVITFDLDNVVFNTNGLAAKIISAFGITPQFSDWGNGYLPDEVHDLLDDIYFGPAIKYGGLTSDRIPEYLAELGKMHEIYYVSARPVPKLLDVTFEQFRRNGMDIPRDRLVLTGSNDKIQTLTDLNTTLHIDDSGAVIKACIENGINHCMISNELTASNYPLRDDHRVRWVHNIDQFWLKRHEFIRGA